MKRIILTACLLAGSPSASAMGLTAPEVTREIHKRGAEAVIRQLWASEQYEALMDHIGTGKPEYLALIPLLVPGADAGTSEMLDLALGYALPHNPNEVFKYLDRPASNPRFPSNQICTLPFWDPTDKEISDYLKQAIPAVRHAKETPNGVKKRCLTGLLASETWLKKRMRRVNKKKRYKLDGRNAT